jgi:lysophospholipase L1-like esterase
MANTFWQRLTPLLTLVSVLLSSQLLTTPPSFAAAEIAVRYGFFTQAVPIADLHQYAATGNVSSSLENFLRFLQPEDKIAIRDALQSQFPVNRVLLDRLLNSPTGKRFLAQLAQADDRPDTAGIQSLRSALIRGTQANQLSLLSALEAYPNPRLTINLAKAWQVFTDSSPQPPHDRLPSIPAWQTWVQYQAAVSQGEHYQGCLFGDSISSGLGQSLGDRHFNFAAGGMSTVSLMSQMQTLVSQDLQCQTVIIAIGTNDAWYDIDDAQFAQNVTAIVQLAQSLAAKQIYLLPAFYSTLEASRNPKMAGTIQRVDEINQLLKKVATAQGIPMESRSLAPLFAQKALKRSLTGDGVHLNDAGKVIYRQALRQLLAGHVESITFSHQ